MPEGSLYLAFRLPKIFRQAGWAVDLLCLQGDPVAHSRYVSRAIQEKTFEDLFGRLKMVLRDPARPWQSVVVAHEETVRRLVATGEVDLLKRWQPGALDPLTREFFLSKFGLAPAGVRWELPIPPSRTCRTRSEIEQFGEDCGWPVIVKPPGASGGVGITQYKSAPVLAAADARMDFPVLAQKFIHGHHGVAEMLCSGGRVLAWLTSYSLKRNHGNFGPSTARLFRPMPELQTLVERVARRTQFEGFCGFDWIEEASTGRHYLIEFHPRPASGFRFGHRCGVNFSAAVADWLGGEAGARGVRTQPAGTALAAHYFSSDLLRCLRERDWQGLRPWLPGSGARHDVFWDDLPLLVAWAKQRVLRQFGR